MALRYTPFVFDCPPTAQDSPHRVLRMTANRYWTDDSMSNDEGLSMLLAHGIGAHKEQWEPIIEQVFRMQRHKPRSKCVREAWAFDWPSHGDAAVLNRELLASTRQMGVCKSRPRPHSPCAVPHAAFEWAAAIAGFLRSPCFRGKRAVAVAHSAGASALLLAVKDIPVGAVPYVSIVFIEPYLATRPIYYTHVGDTQQALVAATIMRRARWGSRAEAAAWLRARAPWKFWDARVLQRFVEHGLADADGDTVALKCDRRLEALAFPDVHPHFAAVGEFARMCHAVPIHLVWASRGEIVPKAVQDALVDESHGRVAASITRVQGGHMVVQENPDIVARVICTAIDAVGVDLRVRARL
ncbi:Alpha/beta hydrolase fold-1 [Mycena pura]|uniref:Alpha/beta hydrolase fold-1 n=1 Tax=Mycena pura TaxID=153505 RepID=A0AAD6YDL1_9AGAR|nr:Alpha/beta hydrolase fold-1 [Mycena pura]